MAQLIFNCCDDPREELYFNYNRFESVHHFYDYCKQKEGALKYRILSDEFKKLR